jgi:hypothetical protein
MASCYALVGVAGCGGFGQEAAQAAPDAQAESSGDALLQTDATAADAATSADAATGDALTDSAPPPRCDPTKPFATPTKVSLGGLDVIVDALGSFQVDPGETRAFLQQASKIRQYDLQANNVLAYVQAVPDLAMTYGFAVSASGLELLGGDSVVFRRYTRASLTAAWGTGTDITVPIAIPDGSTLRWSVRASYVGEGPVFYFGRFVYYGNAAPSEWDIVRAAPGDASTSIDTTFQSELHAGDAGGSFAYVNDPVMVDDRTMYLARWGGGPAPHLARATRLTPQAPWSMPVDLPVGALIVAATDTVKPYAVTPDECSLYFGYAASIDGGFTLDGPFVLYVARRPP